MLNKKVKCTVCGHSFKLNKKMVYEIQEESTPIAILSLQKNKIYNAADCPNCSCQMVFKERIPKVIITDGKDENNNDNVRGNSCCTCLNS